MAPLGRSTLPLALAGALLLPISGPAWPQAEVDGRIVRDRETVISKAEGLLAGRDAVAALALIEQAAPAWPDDDRFYRLRVAALSDMGNSDRAWSLYRARPELFSAEQAERFEADRLARQVLWTREYVEDESQPFADAQRAEDEIQAYARARGGIAALSPRIRYDRLIVLNRLNRHAEVAAEYGDLQAAGHDVPGYALGVVGDSLLALRRPEDAQAALDGALHADPGNIDVNVQRAYAVLEQERHDEARVLLQALRDREAAWPRQPGAARGWQNWRRDQADLNHALVHAFGEDLPQAQALLEERVAVGPANAGLQSALGTVYALRGWPERALERFRMASTLDERDAHSRIGQVGALIALQRDDLARPVRDDLVRRHGELPAVQRMDQAWQLHRGWQWRAHAAGGRSEDGAAVSPLGSRDRRYGVEVQTPILGDRWRLVAGYDYRWADFDGARVEDRRTSAGVRYAHDRLDWGLQANRARDGLGGTGLDADAGWRFDDTWYARATVRRNDADASMQARAAGIVADSVGLEVNNVPSERTYWHAGVKHWRYDDGNRRDSLALGLDQRLFTRPQFLLNGLAGAYASRSSRDDAPYFNPSRDASLELGLRADHLAWRRYERHFRHRLTVSAGPYRQQGYGSAWVPAVRYEHEWQFALGRVLSYGLNWSRPVYDGQREERIGFDAEFRWGE
ncbi:poly-beta-1,6 N-acetyl-D-glucosamine export porin PgaA [Luteimonas sp. Y-2-2-4F]|nr:poly-beta-1,6 N-acetyl-D-glucosamine export porin PgaA [Luteimonas sp. Y-2-2-4F]MCD9033056.1 poly-beta-1,6 N-acetyl-D-glucosamine export porin PgaA [Luteimonas sp. Y-2-2-4F]